MFSFNLLTEPWILVNDQNGNVKEMGIIEVLENAHKIVSLADATILIRFSIYRFLIALIMDIFKIKELEQVEELIMEGNFNKDAIDEYINEVGEGYFDLFHPNTPFLQSPKNEDLEIKPVAEVLQHVPSGSFSTHFNHVNLEKEAYSPAVCAGGLLTIAPFMTAGGAGYSPSINGNPPWYVLVLGKNLFETIVLNCCGMPIPGLTGDGLPAWRTTKRIIPKAELKCSSLLEGLTWRPRWVRLIPEEGGICTYTGKYSPILVRKINFSYGFKAVGGWTDPQVSYVYTNKGPSPLRPKQDRELWRDLGPLMLLRRADYESDKGKIQFNRPLVVEQLMELKKTYVLPASFPEQVEVYGVRTDGKMKIFEWQYEKLTLPPGLSSNDYAGRMVQEALELAERVSYFLGQALRKLYPREGKGNKKALGSRVQLAEHNFWSMLRGRFEEEYLQPLALQSKDEQMEVEKIKEDWKRILIEVGERSFETAIRPFDSKADFLRQQVIARDFFRQKLWFTLYGGKKQEEKGGLENGGSSKSN
jgi:CRISPR system Cascade subunit CasA